MKSLSLAGICLATIGLGLAAGEASAADRAWPKIQAKDWQLASSDDEMRFFIKPAAPGPRHPRLMTRFETREQQTQHGVTYRSMLRMMEFNCAKRKLRALLVGAYKANNMKGLVESALGADDWYAIKDDTFDDLASRIACADFTPVEQTAVWPALRKGDWELIEDEDDAKIYALAEWRRTYPRAWIREELIEPQEFNNRAYRSSRSLVEFDCKRDRVRTSLSIQYPQNNLQGVADMSGAMSEWYQPDLGAAETIVARRVCDAEGQAPAAGDPENLGLVAVNEDAKYKGVQPLDWTPLGLFDTLRLFVQATNGATYPQVLVRVEFLKPIDLDGFKAQSSVGKFEVDCTARRVREKSLAAYAQPNLKGAGVDLTETSTDWRSMEDDTHPLGALKPLCNLRLGEDKGEAVKPAAEPAPPMGPGVAGLRSAEAAA